MSADLGNGSRRAIGCRKTGRALPNALEEEPGSAALQHFDSTRSVGKGQRLHFEERFSRNSKSLPARHQDAKVLPSALESQQQFRQRIEEVLATVEEQESAGIDRPLDGIEQISMSMLLDAELEGE